MKNKKISWYLTAVVGLTLLVGALFQYSFVDAQGPLTVLSSLNLSSPNEVAVDGNRAYVVGGTTGVPGSGYLAVVDIQNTAAPTVLGTYSFPTAVPLVVAAKSGYAYVGGDDAQFVIIDATNPASPQPSGSLGSCTNPGDAEVFGNRMVISCNTFNGMAVLDLTNPAAPVQISTFSTASPNGVAYQNNIVYVAKGSSGGLFQAFDVSNPSVPFSTGYKFLSQSRDVALFGNRAYVMSVNPSPTLYVVDITDNSTGEEEYPVLGSLAGGTLTDPKDVETDGTFAYVANEAGNSISVFDVTSGTPVPAAVASGSIYNGTRDVEVVGTILVSVSKAAGKLVFTNISSLFISQCAQDALTAMGISLASLPSAQLQTLENSCTSNTLQLIPANTVYDASINLSVGDVVVVGANSTVNGAIHGAGSVFLGNGSHVLGNVKDVATLFIAGPSVTVDGSVKSAAEIIVAADTNATLNVLGTITTGKLFLGKNSQLSLDGSLTVTTELTLQQNTVLTIGGKLVCTGATVSQDPTAVVNVGGQKSCSVF
jgi:hypothetical protein